MTKSIPCLWASSRLNSIATGNESQDQGRPSLWSPAHSAHNPPCSSRDSLSGTTEINIEDPQYHTPVSSVAPSAHYQAGQDALTALTKFAEFIGNNLQESHVDYFPEHKKICLDSLVAASVAEDRSVIEENLRQVDEGLVDLAGDLKMKKWRPDLSPEEYTVFEDLYDQAEYRGAKFRALALNPDGCTELLKVDDTSINGYDRRNRTNDWKNIAEGMTVKPARDETPSGDGEEVFRGDTSTGQFFPTYC